jgi:Tol biopolymer transport system component/predicted Ser/Thr protein kinase
MLIQPGIRIGAYEIVSALGAGGMGEVFAAEDTRLHREVAIKFLPAEVASDPEHRERFQREARAIAALNHPNIVTLYSVEEAEGLIFLAMERLTGRTLREVIPAGGLPIAQLLRIASDIADAIAAAHQRGITHRDLKPANVMITADGRVKVLDFGLAKFQRTATDQDDISTRAALTGPYQVMGTAAYMSPEQAEGKTVDFRSDIFSFGVLLHEMATGEAPFQGDSSASIISAILRDHPPPLTELRPELPAGLNKVVRRSLAKDPSGRYQSAVDLRHDLEELAEAGSFPARAALAPRFAMRGMYLAAVALIVVIASVIAWVNLPLRRTPVAFQAEEILRLTSDGDVNVAAISHDGRYVAHVKRVDGRSSLWVRQTATTTDVQIVEPWDLGYQAVTYSPDGSYIYLTTARGSGSLFRVSALGGTPRRLVENLDSGVTFSPDGKQLAFIRQDGAGAQSGVMVTDTNGGNERRIATVGLSLITPSWSPEGGSILVVARTTDLAREAVYEIDVRSGLVEQVTDPSPPIGPSGSRVAWLPDGKSFLMSAADRPGNPAQIWQVFILTRERRRITNDLNSYSEFTISADGRTLAAVQTQTIAALRRIADGRGSSTPLLSGRADDGSRGVAWSANGQIVFASSRSGKTELWAVQADGTRLRPLTETSGWSPATSKDGRSFVFVDERQQLWRGSFDGSPPFLLTPSSNIFNPWIDSKGWVHYQSFAGHIRTFRVPLDGGAPEATSAESENFPFLQYDTLPDGSLVGAQWNEQQRSYFAAIRPAAGGPVHTLRHVVLQSPNTPSLRVTSDGALSFLQRTADRKELWRQSIQEGPPVQLTHSSGDDIFAYAWSPDGKELVVSQGRAARDVVLIRQK